MKEISSIQNPLIKKIVTLQNKSRERRKTGLFVIEGLREITLAIHANYRLKYLVINEAKYGIDQLPVNTKFLKDTEIVTVNDSVYHKLAYRGSTEGIMAVAIAKEHKLENFNFETQNPLLLVAEAPEKPGNTGALLRTADAAGIDAVIIANPKTDLYNPNTIRNSVGCIFTTNVITGSTGEIISFLNENDIAIYAAALEASVPYTNINFKKSSAIVVGTEATGLEKEWLKNAKANIIIPMQGKIDSMNVSVAAAIIIFEARRQRGFTLREISNEIEKNTV